MSGTSMSSPNVAGLAALVKQYLMNDERFTDLPEEHMREMINTLLMSTAIPASYEDEFFGELPYSPRQQGAGMANVNNAVRTNAYLSVPGMTGRSLSWATILKKPAYTSWSSTFTTSDRKRSAIISSPR